MANYKAALELLKERFGEQKVIQRTYINDLFNLKTIYGKGDMHR